MLALIMFIALNGPIDTIEAAPSSQWMVMNGVDHAGSFTLEEIQAFEFEIPSDL